MPLKFLARIRNRLDHNELIEESMSTSLPRTSSTAVRSNRSRSQSNTGQRTCAAPIPMTPEQIEVCTIAVQQKIRSSSNEHLIDPDDHDTVACGYCSKRIGKFSGDQCMKHASVCKHCSYVSLLYALQQHVKGILVGNCILCNRPITRIIRVGRKRRSTMIPENTGDENRPAIQERSISFQDYAQSWLRESSNSGRVNKGYESSTSF